mmetsp:Transcript_21891/g.44855  ORF Transcript_21891/g.44855 Transcript_21891/m.44855 type:complete len:367 (-) Transcript_21891:120-1220(-)
MRWSGWQKRPFPRRQEAESVWVLNKVADVETRVEHETAILHCLLTLSQSDLLLPKVGLGSVDTQHDRVHRRLQLLLLGLEVLFPRLQRTLHEPIIHLLELLVEALAVTLRDLRLVDILQSFPRALHVDPESLFGDHLAARKVVLILVLVRLLQHLLNVRLGQATLLVGDLDFALHVRLRVLSGHLEDTIGVDVEGHLDLGHTAQRLRDVLQCELPEVIVILHLGTLTLVDLDVHISLVVFRSGEVLVLVCRDRAVALDELLHQPTCHLDTQRQGGNVEEEHVLHLLSALARHNGGLHSGPVSHGLVGVDVLAELLSIEEGLDQVLHLRNPCGATHHDHLRDLGLRHGAVREALRHRLHGLLEIVHV